MLSVNIGGFRVEAGGIVALADLTTIASRCALTGGATWLDVFVLCPGIHLQQRAAELANLGELPPTAAMTTGYVFRTENQAMVGYLQRTGKAGHLSDAHVTMARHVDGIHNSNPFSRSAMATTGVVSSLLYLCAVVLTIATIVMMAICREWWTVAILGILMFARAMNTYVIRQRTEAAWKGAKEPGVYGDLIILLSQDRWVRMRGLVDDLKAVTSGQWLQDMTPVQSFISAAATLLVYGTAALGSNGTVFGNIVIMGLLFSETALLALSNELADGLLLHDRVVKIDGSPKKYNRRLDMTKELIQETRRDDWAVGLGMILPSEARGVMTKGGTMEPTTEELQGKAVLL